MENVNPQTDGTMRLHDDHTPSSSGGLYRIKQLVNEILSSLSLNPPNPHSVLQIRGASAGMENNIYPSIQDGTTDLHGSTQFEEEKAYIEEGLKQVLLSLALKKLNPESNSKLAMTESCEAASNFELNNDADWEAEGVTVYFRLYSEKPSCGGDWFSIPTRHPSLSTDGYIYPVFKETDLKSDTFFPYLVAVGPYIFTIYPVEDKNEEDIPSRSVRYHDTRNNKDGWNQAPPLKGETHHYYFFEANDKIYGLGMFDPLSPEGVAFDLKCLDCHELDEGWQSIYPVSDEASELAVRFCVTAFKLDYEDTTDSATGKIKSHARRALFYALGFWTSYDFETNEFNVCEVHSGLLLYTEAVGFGDMLFFLTVKNKDERVYLMAYNDPFVQKGCPTPVFGLEHFDNALPVGYIEDSLMMYPPAKLLLMGRKGCFCIIWADVQAHIAISKIHCTKFDLHVQDEKLHAVNVSTLVYKVKGVHFDFVDAVVSDSKMISQFLERENEKRRGGCPRHVKPEKATKEGGMRRFKLTRNLSMLTLSYE